MRARQASRGQEGGEMTATRVIALGWPGQPPAGVAGSAAGGSGGGQREGPAEGARLRDPEGVSARPV